MKVLVWMSGWVDSAVAAHLLLQQGYEVIAWFMKNYADEDNPDCHTKQDRDEAIKVAKHLGIKDFRIFDFREIYDQKIIQYIYNTYQQGLTPNPDVLCNSEIKFKLFLDKALELWCGYVATGHYARIIVEDKKIKAKDAKIKKEIDKKTYDIMGLCMKIHNEFGNTLTEKQYENILKDALKEHWYHIQTQVTLPINYKWKNYWSRYIDIVIDNTIIIELKVLKTQYELKKWYKQTRSYLEIWDYKAWLLIDFGWEKLRYHRLNNFSTSFLSSEKSYHLLKGVDNNKDQSYFLSGLNQFQLSKSLFPLGELTKPQIRHIAKDIWLPNAERKDSQWLCFIGKVDMKTFLQQKLPIQKGQIKDEQGNILWEHDGIWFYTIGQRQGLGLAWWPRYVIERNIKNNELIVGPKDTALLYHNALLAHSWHRIWTPQELPFEASAKIRYRQADQVCTVAQSDKQTYYHISFKDAQRAISPWQTIVIYQWDELIASGIIEQAMDNT